MMKRKLHHFIFKAIERSKPFLLEEQYMYDIDFKSKSELLELVKSHSNKEFLIIPSAKYNPTLDYGYRGAFIKLEDNKFNLYYNRVFTHEIDCVEIAEDELPDSGHFITEF